MCSGSAHRRHVFMAPIKERTISDKVVVVQFRQKIIRKFKNRRRERIRYFKKRLLVARLVAELEDRAKTSIIGKSTMKKTAKPRKIKLFSGLLRVEKEHQKLTGDGSEVIVESNHVTNDLIESPSDPLDLSLPRKSTNLSLPRNLALEELFTVAVNEECSVEVNTELDPEIMVLSPPPSESTRDDYIDVIDISSSPEPSPEEEEGEDSMDRVLVKSEPMEGVAPDTTIEDVPQQSQTLTTQVKSEPMDMNLGDSIEVVPSRPLLTQQPQTITTQVEREPMDKILRNSSEGTLLQPLVKQIQVKIEPVEVKKEQMEEEDDLVWGNDDTASAKPLRPATPPAVRAAPTVITTPREMSIVVEPIPTPTVLMVPVGTSATTATSLQSPALVVMPSPAPTVFLTPMASGSQQVQTLQVASQSATEAGDNIECRWCLKKYRKSYVKTHETRCFKKNAGAAGDLSCFKCDAKFVTAAQIKKHYADAHGLFVT